MTFTRLDTSGNGKNGSGLLHAVETLLSSIFIPALKNLDKGWGALGTPSGEQVRQDFLNTLDSFVSVLVGEEFFKLYKQLKTDYLKHDQLWVDMYLIVFYGIILLFKAHKKVWKKRSHSSPVRHMTCPRSRPQLTTRQWPTALRPWRGSRTAWMSGWSSWSRSWQRANRWGRKQMTLDPGLSSTTGRNGCHASTTSWIRSKDLMWKLCWVSYMPPNPSSSR